MRSLLPAVLLLTVATGGPTAHAAYPEDVSLSGLSSYQGDAYTNTEKINEAYRTVVRDIATGMANKPQGGATLGIDGFEVGVNNTFTFVEANQYQGGATAWERARTGNQATGALWMPELAVRKGLPLSLEAGVHLGWMAMTRQGVAGGYGRFAPLEGQHKLPEVAIQAGYTGYVGNDELEIGVTDLSLSVGKTVAFSPLQASSERTIHPFAAFAMNWIRASPLLPEDQLADLNIGRMTAKKKDTETFHEDMRQMAINAGVRIVSGDVGFRTGVSIPLNASPTIDVGVAYVY